MTNNALKIYVISLVKNRPFMIEKTHCGIRYLVLNILFKFHFNSFFFQVISMSHLRSFNPRWRKETSPMSKHSYETQSKKVSFVILTDSSSRWRFSLCQGLLNIIFFIHNNSLFAKNVNVFQGRRKGKFQSLCSFQWKPVESLPWTDNPSSESKYTIMTDRERIRKRSLLWH